MEAPDDLQSLQDDFVDNRPRQKGWLERKPHSDAFVFAVATMLLITLISILQWNIPGAFEFLAVNKKLVLTDGQYYRLFSALLIHSDLKHLLSNLFYASVLTFFLVGYFGFRLVPLAAILFGGLTNLLTLTYMADDQYLLGFSGVVFWLGSAWLTLYFFLMTKYSLTNRILRTISISLLIFFPSEAFDPTISYRAHLFGFIGGIIFGVIFYLINRKLWNPSSTTDLPAVADHQYTP